MKQDRKLHISVQQASRGRQKRAMSVQQALEWAFRVEHAQLEAPDGLISGGMLRELTVTNVTPKAKPWARD